MYYHHCRLNEIPLIFEYFVATGQGQGVNVYQSPQLIPAGVVSEGLLVIPRLSQSEGPH